MTRSVAFFVAFLFLVCLTAQPVKAFSLPDFFTKLPLLKSVSTEDLVDTVHLVARRYEKLLSLLSLSPNLTSCFVCESLVGMGVDVHQVDPAIPESSYTSANLSTNVLKLICEEPIFNTLNQANVTCSNIVASANATIAYYTFDANFPIGLTPTLVCKYALMYC